MTFAVASKSLIRRGDRLRVFSARRGHSVAVTVRSLRIEASGRIGLLVDDARATLRQVMIGASKVPLVVQNAALSDQVVDRVTGPDGKAVTPVESKTHEAA